MTPSDSIKLAHLEPSVLGTKEYWDNLYLNELANYDEDAANEGTIWFDDSDAEEKILEYLERHIMESQGLGKNITKENCSFLDLGTGNGHFLFKLRSGQGDVSQEYNGWGGRLLGVDYSEKSITFSRRIGTDKERKDIEFKCWDILTGDPIGVILEGENVDGWNVVLDKGTFDAISLSSERDASGRRIIESYREKIIPLIKPDGILIITCCNWTEQELKLWFCGPELAYLDTIHYKSYSFGGQTGQTVSSVSFRKILSE